MDQETALAESEERDHRRGMLNDALKGLNARERRVFEARRLAEDPLTLEELSAEFGVSRERIRQIEVRAFEKVQKAVTKAASAAAQPEPAPAAQFKLPSSGDRGAAFRRAGRGATGMKQLTVSGVEIAYLDEGKGPAVILGHCSSASHKEWLPLIETLKSDWRVLAPDFIGYGQSAPWPADRAVLHRRRCRACCSPSPRRRKASCISSAIPTARLWLLEAARTLGPRVKSLTLVEPGLVSSAAAGAAARMGRGRDARPRRARRRGKGRRPRRSQILHDLLAWPLALVAVARALQSGDRGDHPQGRARIRLSPSTRPTTLARLCRDHRADIADRRRLDPRAQPAPSSISWRRRCPTPKSRSSKARAI